MTQNQPTRRDALATALAAATAGLALGGAPQPIAAAAAAAQAAADPASKDPKPMQQPEYYELRAYRLRRGPMTKRLDDYLRGALVPAAGRAGCSPVGVFNVTLGMQNPSVYVLIPHPTLDSFAGLPAKLDADAEYRKAAEPFLALPPTDPPYAQLDVRLMRAFPHMPKLELPPATAGKQPRIFELRTYRSHGDPAGRKKVEMFDTAGEITIFRRVGLAPVFFASDLTGEGLPSLTYLLTYPDMAAREKAWATFRADPEWVKLRTTSGFTDAEIVTGIDNQVLAPAEYSQV